MCTAGTITIGEANEVNHEFLRRLNDRFAVAAEHPDVTYRPVSAEVSLIETVCIEDVRKVMQ